MRYAIWIILLFTTLSVNSEEINFVNTNTPDTAKVHFQINDEKGEVLPCSVSLINENGEGIWGLDALGNPVNYPHQPRFWISGDTVVSVTPDHYKCMISRPYRYRTKSLEFNLSASSNEVVQATLDLVVDMPAYGWYAGDAHQHIVHGEQEFAVNPEYACRVAQAEGADWSSFNSGYSCVPGENLSLQELRMKFQKLSNDRFHALLGDEYPKDHLGHMAFFAGAIKNWNEEIGSNPYSPGPNETENYAHFEIMREVEERHGLCIYTHPVREYGGTDESPANIARELPFDILAAPELIHTVDWMTDNPHDPAAMKLWSMYLNVNHQIGICAFSDTCYDRHDARPFNKRTYVYLGDNKPSMSNLVFAIKQGRTFGTSGPLLLISLAGRPPGVVLQADNKEREIQFAAFAPGCDYADREKQVFLNRIEIIRNGEVIHTENLEGQEKVAFNGSAQVKETENAWYIVKAFTNVDRQVAITSPYYFRESGFTPPKALQANVKVQLVDANDGTPIAGNLELLEYAKQESEVVRRLKAGKEGSEFSCSPTLRIRASVPGYQSQTKSIFFDSPELYDELIRPLDREKQLASDYYRKIVKACLEIQFTFKMKQK